MYPFADDLKLMRIIQDDSNVSALQNDIFRIMDWSSKWLLELNFDQCHVTWYGSSIRPSYFFDQSKTRPVPVQFTDEERDVGVVFDNDLTSVKH